LEQTLSAERDYHQALARLNAVDPISGPLRLCRKNPPERSTR